MWKWGLHCLSLTCPELGERRNHWIMKNVHLLPKEERKGANEMWRMRMIPHLAPGEERRGSEWLEWEKWGKIRHFFEMRGLCVEYEKLGRIGHILSSSKGGKERKSMATMWELWKIGHICKETMEHTYLRSSTHRPSYIVGEVRSMTRLHSVYDNHNRSFELHTFATTLSSLNSCFSSKWSHWFELGIVFLDVVLILESKIYFKNRFSFLTKKNQLKFLSLD